MKHICDCGATYSNLDALYACQNANHYESPSEIEKLRRVYEHARGMCFGVDWNKGTHAKHHRQKLIQAVNEIEALPTVCA